MISRLAGFVYGLACYVGFLVVFLYAMGFLGNFIVPKSIDSGATVPLTEAILVNCGLLAIFALQHSIMARQWFKSGWTKIVAKPVERSTYVMLSNLAMILLFWQWRPMTQSIWNVESSAGSALLWGLFGLGWLLVLVSSFSFDHFDLFGMRQVYLYYKGKEYVGLDFTVPGLYKVVRHPLYVGWFLAFWATPNMTAGHLLFAAVASAYILVAIQFEERDLISFFGAKYEDYRKNVPMLIPFLKGKG